MTRWPDGTTASYEASSRRASALAALPAGGSFGGGEDGDGQAGREGEAVPEVEESGGDGAVVGVLQEDAPQDP